jgi:oligopeptide/dipeptide ABC transporter ATP-binding protein
MTDATPALLDLDEIVVHYPAGRTSLFGARRVVHAVDGLSLAIPEGETFGLVGESGSGKSTAARIALQLERPTAGEVRYRGEPLNRMDRAARQRFRREVQAVFQDPGAALNPRMRVADVVGEPLDIHDLVQGRRQRRERIADLLRAVGLPAAAQDRYPHEFSGGQRQRICVARALSTDPRLIVLDEPVSALDVSIRAQILNLLKDLQERLGLAYLFIAHDLAVVEFISHRVGVMYLGKLVEVAPTAGLFRRPLHPYTIALMASAPKVERAGTVQGFAIEGEIPSPIEPPSGCRFRTRCPFAENRCAEVVPPLQDMGDGHFVACIKVDDVRRAVAGAPTARMGDNE